jgi:hypothetical protein
MGKVARRELKVSAATLHKNSKGKKGFQPGNEYRFKSGYDSKRNYHGRPKDHDELRELIRDVAAELSQDKKYSRVYKKIQSMFDSRDPRDSIAVIEHGWGKVPEKLEIDDGKFKEYQETLKRFLDKAKQDSIEGGSNDET